MNERRLNIRIICVAALALAAMLKLGARLMELHTGPHEDCLRKIEGQRLMFRNLPGPRGKITDRNGQTLALDVAMWQMWADPSRLNGDLEHTAEILSDTTGRPVSFYREKLSAPCKFVFLPEYGVHISSETRRAITERNAPAVFFEEIFHRFYPLDECMCHALGFVNLERVGSSGIEQKLDEFLKGVPGWIESEFDGRRQELYERRSREVRPKPGANVTLTLDQYIQYITELALEMAMESNKCAAAWAMVQKINTGEILAMASRPAYNPNRFQDATREQTRNRCIGVVYEPGSTFKITTLSAAFNEGLVTPEDILDCENGCWFYHGRPLRDYHPYGLLSVADVIKKSSNIGTAKISLMLNQKRLYEYVRAFGFGSPTGIELPGEEAGLLAPPEQWNNISLTRIAIGHGVAVTAAQMLNAMCAIANDGVLMKPYIVAQIQDETGKILFKQEPSVVSRPISLRTARLMRKLLTRVTEKGGTGTRAAVEGYEVAGKTGTAQKPVAGGYSEYLNVSSFAGFLPADNPQIGIIVVLDEPHGLRTGGATAAPVFSQIASDAVRYLNIPPSRQLIVAESE